jgi:TolB-like protein/DNA-binding winged helix-turn-helix (wHTH) protein/Flp pilus assembly protein TadD
MRKFGEKCAKFGQPNHAEAAMPALEVKRTVLAFSGCRLDVSRGTLTRDGVEAHLRPKSYAVLRHLAENSGRLVSKQELLDAVWGSTVVTEGSLTQCVIEIRRALGPSGQQLLRTVPRLGFILDAAVAEVGDATAPPTPDPPELPQAHPANSPGRQGRSLRWGIPLMLASLLAAGWLLVNRGPDDAVRPDDAPVPRSPPNSIAVLRFQDLSPKGDQAFFADGLAEEILHELASAPSLRVTARSSSFAFDPGTENAADAARALGVAHVLEGSVRRAGDELRVTARLVDVATRTVRWSRTYDRNFSQHLELQRELAADVAAALKVTLARPTQSSPASKVVAKANELFLHSRFLFHRRLPGDLAAAERDLQQAVALDPRHARAWTLLAGAIEVRGVEELGDHDYRLEEQQQALERALQIDPGLAGAHVRLARVLARRGDLEGSRAAFQRAAELEPGHPLVLFGRSRQKILEGLHDAAAALEQQAVAIDPLSAIYRGNLGRTLLAAGRSEEALVELRRAAELSAQPAFIAEIARALLVIGKTDEARRVAASLPGGPQRDQLDLLLDGVDAHPQSTGRLRSSAAPHDLILLAEAEAHAGRRQAALDLIEESLRRQGPARDADERTEIQLEIVMSPFLRALHDDPRWARLTRSGPAS